MKKTILKGNPIDTYIRIIALTILLAASYFIVKPFLLIIIWSALVAVALYPFYIKVIKFFKGKKKGLVTSVFILVLLAIILVPTVNISSSIVSSVNDFKESFEAGTVVVHPPADKVKDWPLIGERVYDFWSASNKNLENTLRDHKDQLKSGLGKLFSSFTGLLGTVFLALFSLIFAGVFMASADGGYQTSVKFANRLIPGKGEDLIIMITSTIRSVVKGILLVAIIQSILAYIGFAVIGLPGAGIFALFVLILGIIQVPALLAMIPAIAIVFSTHDSMPAIIFTVYSIAVALSDNFLKPMLLGKGLQTPMLVILIGALGGMMFMGMLGLFIGPVILAIAYQLYTTW
ncbi:MAG: AI-2E family transporter, partial [Bacteroidales bacterium]|nr:AI-2E family transporter [Bacteroidales bacterium]